MRSRLIAVFPDGKTHTLSLVDACLCSALWQWHHSPDDKHGLYASPE